MAKPDEILQIDKITDFIKTKYSKNARKLDITEEIYFEVISQKTASLIATVCEAASASVDREDPAENMRKFGELVGLAFQIKDDLFDYGGGGDIGKPTGVAPTSLLDLSVQLIRDPQVLECVLELGCRCSGHRRCLRLLHRPRTACPRSIRGTIGPSPYLG